MDSEVIGQKIKNFRHKAGLSQFKLEGMIDASPGSISRIENGEVNPSKETIIKIIEVLDIRSKDAASLFNIDFDELPKMISLAKKLSASLNLDTVLQNSVNEVVFELDLLGAIVCLLDGSNLYAKTITQTWYTELATKVLGGKVTALKTSLSNKENYMVRSILENKVFVSDNLKDFTIGVMPERTSKLLAKVTNTRCGISLPILSDSKMVGSILFSKNYKDNFENEVSVLKSFSEHIGISIANARKYEELKYEINLLKNERGE